MLLLPLQISDSADHRPTCKLPSLVCQTESGSGHLSGLTFHDPLQSTPLPVPASALPVPACPSDPACAGLAFIHRQFLLWAPACPCRTHHAAFHWGLVCFFCSMRPERDESSGPQGLDLGLALVGLKFLMKNSWWVNYL